MKAYLRLALGVALGLAVVQPSVAWAQAEPMSSAVTPLGQLLDSPPARSVLEKHVPKLVASPQITQARSLTLKQIANFAGDALPAEKLAEIDADLAKLPPPK